MATGRYRSLGCPNCSGLLSLDTMFCIGYTEWTDYNTEHMHYDLFCRGCGYTNQEVTEPLTMTYDSEGLCDIL